MYLRKDNTTYTIKKECAKQCNQCKVEEMMKRLSQVSSSDVAAETSEMQMTAPVFIHHNQATSFHFPLYA